MFKLFVTLLRGRNADTAETIADQMALPLLRQQMRDSAAGVETARRSVAMVMAYAERERKSAARITAQLAAGVLNIRLPKIASSEREITIPIAEE